MSLDDLLKDSGATISWSEQRKKLLHVILGLAVLAIGLGGAAYIFSNLRDDRVTAGGVAAVDEKGDIEALTELMRLKTEASQLRQELLEARERSDVAGRTSRLPAGNKGQLGKKTRQDVAQAKARVQIVDFDPGEGFTNVAAKEEDLYIPTGAVFQARLITPIKTSVQRTFVMAETTREFRMDLKRRIKKGSRLIGRSRLNPILKGVVVEFQTIVSPNGNETRLSGLALSRNALPEVDGLYFSDDLQNYGVALAFGFLSGFADAARKREVTIIGSQPEVTLSNQVLAGLSTASFQVAEEILRDVRSQAVEYVVVPAGEPVFVVLTRRLVLAKRGSG